MAASAGDTGPFATARAPSQTVQAYVATTIVVSSTQVTVAATIRSTSYSR